MFGPIMKDWLNYPGFRTVWARESPYFSINLREWHQQHVEGKELTTTGYVGQITSGRVCSLTDRSKLPTRFDGGSELSCILGL